MWIISWIAVRTINGCCGRNIYSVVGDPPLPYKMRQRQTCVLRDADLSLFLSACFLFLHYRPQQQGGSKPSDWFSCASLSAGGKNSFTGKRILRKESQGVSVSLLHSLPGMQKS